MLFRSLFFFSSRRRHTRLRRDWSSDVCSSDLSSFNYSKNWKASSASLGFNTFRDLSIENRTPESFSYLNEGIYKSYKYEDGPKFNFNIGSRKIFGVGDSWYNSVTSSYTVKTSMGRRDHSLIRETNSTDRKSTRLNSSHVVISYAVFCLKKKRSA